MLIDIQDYCNLVPIDEVYAQYEINAAIFVSGHNSTTFSIVRADIMCSEVFRNIISHVMSFCLMLLITL